MKKALSIAVSAAMLFSLSACGSNETIAETPSPTATELQASVETPAVDSSMFTKRDSSTDYDEAAAQQMMRDDPSLRMREDSGRGWRRVVASPKPVDIAERRSILNLLDSEYIVIACGGGGVPVVRDAHGDYYGVDAVIDKDFASACLAEAVGADYLFILTAVDHVCLNFGTPEQRALDELHVDEAETYLRAGQFGSSTEAVQAAVQNRFRQEKNLALNMLDGGGRTALA